MKVIPNRLESKLRGYKGGTNKNGSDNKNDGVEYEGENDGVVYSGGHWSDDIRAQNNANNQGAGENVDDQEPPKKKGKVLEAKTSFLGKMWATLEPRDWKDPDTGIIYQVNADGTVRNRKPLGGLGALGLVGGTGGIKLLNQFNNAENLIQSAGTLTKVKAGMQGFVKGDGASIFKSITQNGTLQQNGQYILENGTQIGNHISKTTGIYTIHITPTVGKIIKIRITP